MKNKKILLDDIDIFIFDFDGVLTDNRVYLNSDAVEWVVCNRSDGLAFDVLRKLNKQVYILSTETNKVVTARATKLKVKVIQAANNKAEALEALTKKLKVNYDKILYVGNDINDYNAMKLCGFSVCPADSNKKIKKIATITLNSCGGDGVVRELLEDIFDIDFIKTLYTNEDA